MKKLYRILTAGLLAVSLLLGQVQGVMAEEGEAAGAAKALQLKEKLGLTDDQVVKLKAIAESEKAEYTPLIKQGLADLKILGDKVKAGAPDAELNPVVDRLESGRRSIEAAKTKYVDQVRAVLNPTQQSKLVLAVAVVKLAILQKLLQGKNKR